MLNQDLCDEFVDNFAKMLPEYDCSEFTVKDPGKTLIPAVWLCPHLRSTLTYTALAQVRSLKGQRLYGSELFRNALNGPTAGTHWRPSMEVERKLREQGLYQ